MGKVRGFKVKSTNIGKILTTGQAAELLNSHVNTLRRWSNMGILATYRVGTREDRRYLKSDLLRLLEGYDNSEGDISELLTTGQAAEFLHVHVSTIRDWANQGEIPSYRLGPRGDRRFEKRALIEYLGTDYS